MHSFFCIIHSVLIKHLSFQFKKKENINTTEAIEVIQ